MNVAIAATSPHREPYLSSVHLSGEGNDHRRANRSTNRGAKRVLKLEARKESGAVITRKQATCPREFFSIGQASPPARRSSNVSIRRGLASSALSSLRCYLHKAHWWHQAARKRNDPTIIESIGVSLSRATPGFQYANVHQGRAPSMSRTTCSGVNSWLCSAAWRSVRRVKLSPNPQDPSAGTLTIGPPIRPQLRRGSCRWTGTARLYARAKSHLRGRGAAVR